MKLSASVTVRKNHVARRIRGVKAGTDLATDLAAAIILAEAQRLAPVGVTKRIRDGLRTRVLVAADTVRTVAVGVWGVKEAGFNERGTVKMHARPYLRPGALLGRRTLKAEAEAKIKAEANAS